MIIAIPVLPDATDYSNLASDLIAAGPYVGHVLLVAASQDHHDEALDLLEALREHFTSAHLSVAPPNLEGSVLESCLFQDICRWAANYTPAPGEIAQPPVLYFDPTYRPTKQSWAGFLQSDYYKRPGSIVGQFEPLDDVQIEVAKGQFITQEGGFLSKGPLMLPQSFAQTSTLLSNIPAQVGWRSWLRFELYVAHSDTETIGTGDEALLSPGGESVAAPKRRGRQKKVEAPAEVTPETPAEV